MNDAEAIEAHETHLRGRSLTACAKGLRVTPYALACAWRRLELRICKAVSNKLREVVIFDAHCPLCDWQSSQPETQSQDPWLTALRTLTEHARAAHGHDLSSDDIDAGISRRD